MPSTGLVEIRALAIPHEKRKFLWASRKHEFLLSCGGVLRCSVIESRFVDSELSVELVVEIRVSAKWQYKNQVSPTYMQCSSDLTKRRPRREHNNVAGSCHAAYRRVAIHDVVTKLKPSSSTSAPLHKPVTALQHGFLFVHEDQACRH